MEAFAETDLPQLFTDCSHALTAGAQSGPCWLRESDEVIEAADGSGQIARVIAAVVQTGQFAGVKVGDTCTVSDGGAGVAYAIRARQDRVDGTTEFQLRRA